MLQFMCLVAEIRFSIHAFVLWETTLIMIKFCLYCVNMPQKKCERGKNIIYDKVNISFVRAEPFVRIV